MLHMHAILYKLTENSLNKISSFKNLLVDKCKTQWSKIQFSKNSVILEYHACIIVVFLKIGTPVETNIIYTLTIFGVYFNKAKIIQYMQYYSNKIAIQNSNKTCKFFIVLLKSKY